MYENVLLTHQIVTKKNSQHYRRERTSQNIFFYKIIAYIIIYKNIITLHCKTAETIERSFLNNGSGHNLFISLDVIRSAF